MFAFAFHKNDPGLSGALPGRKTKQKHYGYHILGRLFLLSGLESKGYYHNRTKNSWTVESL